MIPTQSNRSAAPKEPLQLHEAMLSLNPNDLEGMRREISTRGVQVEHFGPAYSKIAAAFRCSPNPKILNSSNHSK